MILSPTPPPAPPSQPDHHMAQTNPRIESLKAIFPDFDDALMSVFVPFVSNEV